MGLTDLKSITSILIPSFCAAKYVSSATFIILPNDTSVTSFPSCIILDLPIGIKYSSSGT